MNRSGLFLVLVFSIVNHAVAQLSAPVFAWAKQFPGSGSTIVRGMTSDNDAVYVVARFSGSIAFGGTRLTSSGDSDIAFAKYSEAGDLLWAQQVGWLFSDDAGGIAVDAQGNVFIAGWFSGGTIVGSTPLEAIQGGNLYVAKFDRNGTFLWVHQGAGAPIVSDTSGGCYAAVPSLTKIGKDGQTVWSKSVEGGGSSLVAATPDRVLLWTGTILRSFSADGHDEWTASVDQSKRFIYVDEVGTVSAGSPTQVLRFDPRGSRLSSMLLPATYPPGNLDNALMISDSSGYIYSTDTRGNLSKISPSGRVLWESQVPTGTTGVFMTADGTCYFAGSFEDPVTIGGIKLTNPNPAGGAGFITRIDPVPFHIGRAARMVVVSWPVVPRAMLEASTGLQPAAWTAVTKTNSIIEDQNVIVEPMAGGARFYRLRVQQ